MKRPITIAISIILGLGFGFLSLNTTYKTKKRERKNLIEIWEMDFRVSPQLNIKAHAKMDSLENVLIKEYEISTDIGEKEDLYYMISNLQTHKLVWETDRLIDESMKNIMR
jgi:hypothetical protein